MEYLNLENCFHIENDITVYNNFENISKILLKLEHNDKSIYMVKDSPDRVIPSIMYFTSLESSKKLCSHISETVCREHRFMNDMNILATYKDLIQMPFNPASDSNYIFDGAAIGQFLGGPDPRNLGHQENSLGAINNPLIKKFINETCIFKMTDFNIRTEYKKPDHLRTFIKTYSIHTRNKNEFIKNNGENRLLNCTPTTYNEIQNLHIHSKQLYQF